MTMMMIVYCPKCYEADRTHKNGYLIHDTVVDDICTDAGYDLDGREPLPGEQEEAEANDEKYIKQAEEREYTCKLCGHIFHTTRNDPSFHC